MKYKKGTFVVVPNTEYLKGKSSVLLSVFLWLCYHADDDGVCYPSRKKLAEEVGVDVRTIDKYIKVLQEDGIIIKTIRQKKNSKENTSNLYQLLLPSEVDNTTPSERNDTETIPSINYTHLTQSLAPAKPFSFLEELDKLGNSKWKPDLIIYNYYKFTSMSFENEKQWKSARSRFKIPAIKLEGYSAKQINETMQYCEQNYKDVGWSLETCAKVIARVVNIKK